jgi:hypothetical protein
MLKFFVVLLTVVLLTGTAFAGSHEYTYNNNYNYDKDVAMTNAVGGLVLNLFALGSAAGSKGQASYYGGGNGYYGSEGYGGSVSHGQGAVNNVVYVPVNTYTPPPRVCVWVPNTINGQITGYTPFCN